MPNATPPHRVLHEFFSQFSFNLNESWKLSFLGLPKVKRTGQKPPHHHTGSFINFFHIIVKVKVFKALKAYLRYYSPGGNLAQACIFSTIFLIDLGNQQNQKPSILNYVLFVIHGLPNEKSSFLKHDLYNYYGPKLWLISWIFMHTSSFSYRYSINNFLTKLGLPDTLIFIQDKKTDLDNLAITYW